MDGRTRWRRLDAPAWVHVFAMVLTAACTLWALWALLYGLAAGMGVLAFVPFAVPALVGWLTSAWGRERPWSWWVWTALASLAVLRAAPALLEGRAWGIAGPAGRDDRSVT
jgi:hypothetical protein